MNQQTFSYREQGKTFLEQALAELAQNDIRQASEKGWGAASQFAKAIASERDWPHNDHRSLYQAVGRLSDEIDDQELRRLFSIAGQLHTNFYEGWLDRDYVTSLLNDVTRFVGKVDAVLSNNT